MKSWETETKQEKAEIREEKRRELKRRQWKTGMKNHMGNNMSPHGFQMEKLGNELLL